MLIIIINIIDDDLSSSSMSSSLALLVLDVVVARLNVDLKEVLDTVLASRMGEPPMTIGPDGDDDDGDDDGDGDDHRRQASGSSRAFPPVPGRAAE